MRYKKRFFMTVFGIGGCMALMLVGYGVRDSVYEIADISMKRFSCMMDIYSIKMM